METVMKIAILGTGQVGTALATGLLAAGHDVTFGSRFSRSGLAAPALAAPDAVAASDLVINATPGPTSLEYLRSLGAQAFDGKILLDVANASDADGLLYPNDSLARNIQQAFPFARVVKSLNTMNTSVMTNPSVIARTTVFLSGDDAEAKTVVGALLVGLGWDPSSQIDLGDIATAKAPEHYFPLFWATLQALGTPVFNLAVVR
jgi:predicted dinucleotide-binding enzyme